MLISAARAVVCPLSAMRRAEKSPLAPRFGNSRKAGRPASMGAGAATKLMPGHGKGGGTVDAAAAARPKARPTRRLATSMLVGCRRILFSYHAHRHPSGAGH